MDSREELQQEQELGELQNLLSVIGATVAPREDVRTSRKWYEVCIEEPDSGEYTICPHNRQRDRWALCNGFQVGITEKEGEIYVVKAYETLPAVAAPLLAHYRAHRRATSFA